MIIAPLTFGTVLIATISDLRNRKIPNSITLSAIILGLMLNTYYLGLIGLKNSLFGMICGIVCLIIPFAIGGMGAGDVKLLASVGALNGLNFVVFTFLYAAIAGGVIALGVALVRGKARLVIFNVICSIHGVFSHRLYQKGYPHPLTTSSGLKFPYGIAILSGTLVAYYLG